MKTLAGALVGVFVYAAAASGADDAACLVASHLVQVDAALPRVAEAIEKTKSATIVVAGTTSSSLPGPEGPNLAYPARLEVALRKRLPGVAVKVVPYVAPRQTAAAMAQMFPKILKSDKPALVVWQTGTYDAMQGVGPDPFQTTLEQAVDLLREGGADVIFVNMQFSPRTDAVLASQAYAEAIRWVALEHALNLFDRQAIMRQWSELGTFDLLAATKSLDTAAQVHNCIGRLLADLVADALKMNETESREKK
jgi:GDSL-like lipase/acylhydrolase family protein